MEHFPGLVDISVLVGAATLTAFLAGLLRVPLVAALLVTGAVVGPHGFGLVGDTAAIELAAEVGVVLLLFSIGLSLSLSKLKKIGGVVAVGGAIQVGLTVAVVAGLAKFVVGLTTPVSVVLGFAAALSSTALVLRGLESRRELDSPHGRIILGVLIFQDLIVVVFMAAIPALASAGTGLSVGAIAAKFGGKLLAVAIGTGALRLVLPRLLAYLRDHDAEEAFPIGVIAACALAAWLASLAGMSMALGAMLAGIALADSPLAREAQATIGSLRDVFASIFFVSLGMLFDTGRLLSEPAVILGLAAAAIIVKGAIATFAVGVLRFPVPVAVGTGLGLAQIGEFGFLLAQQGYSSGILTQDDVERLVASAVLTMLVTPFFLILAPRVATGTASLSGVEQHLKIVGVADCPKQLREARVVIAGQGPVSNAVIERLEKAGVTYVVLEMNPDSVRTAQESGQPVFHGDASSTDCLRAAGLVSAETLIVGIGNEAEVGRVVAAARELRPDIPIIVRTKYNRTASQLRETPGVTVVAQESLGAEAVGELVDERFAA